MGSSKNSNSPLTLGMLPSYRGGALLLSSREEILKNRVLCFPKFSMQQTNEGGEVLNLGGAHLHEGNLEALAWERQVPNMNNTISLNMTR